MEVKNKTKKQQKCFPTSQILSLHLTCTLTQDTDAENEVNGIKGSLTKDQLMNFAE